MNNFISIQEFINSKRSIENRDYLYQLMNGKKISQKVRGKKVFKRGKEVKKFIPPKMVEGVHNIIENGKSLIHKDLKEVNAGVSMG